MKKFMHSIEVMFPVLVLLITGCQVDDIMINTDTTGDNRMIEIAAPAGEITYKISDFLEDIDNEYVFVGEDGLVYVAYTQNVDIDWETLVILRDFSDTWYYSLPRILPVSPMKAASQGSFTEKIKLNVRDDVRYDSLSMEGGTLAAQLTVPYGTTGQITVIIPEVEKNGSPLKYFFTADQYNHTFNIYENLQGLRVEPSQGRDSSYVSVITSLSLNNVAVGDVALDFFLTNMQPGMTFGYFGQQEASKIDEELVLDVFDDLELADEIEFHDFSINLNVTSEIGVPFDVTVKDVKSYDENDQQTNVLLVNSNSYVNLSLDAATYGNPITEAVISFDINGDNSNVVEIGNSYPRKLVFDVTSFSNPGGDTGDFNFMGPENALKGELNVVMPAWFSTTKEYFRTDTVDFDIHDILDDNEDDAREIDELKVYFDFYSKIPVDISAAAWVIDGTGYKIDDLLESKTNVVAAGVPDGNTGRVNKATHTTFEVTVSGDQVNRFLDENAMEIVLGTYFDTGDENGQGIKIYDDMDFRAVVSFEASGKIPTF